MRIYTFNKTENVTLSILELENLYRNVYELWIFGYGSILWKPGFTYKSREVGKVRNYVRRFWQGNVTHRGTPESPGRVATLIDDKEGEVWGMAFQLVGRTMIKKALHHLGVRECALGGYQATVVPFEGCGLNGEKTYRNVLVFRASPENPYYLGPAPVQDMASQIVFCVGRTGHNVEYVTRLADFIRRHIPDDRDKHLFELDYHLREILKQNQTWLNNVLRNTRKKETWHIRNLLNKRNENQSVIGYDSH